MISSPFVKLSTLVATSLIIAHSNIQPVRAGADAATYSATYLPYNAPKISEPGQTGTNQVCRRLRPGVLIVLLNIAVVGPIIDHDSVERKVTRTLSARTCTVRVFRNNEWVYRCSDASADVVNAVDDFCLWAPPANTSSYGDSSIANTERIEVAWCLRVRPC